VLEKYIIISGNLVKYLSGSFDTVRRTEFE